MSRLLLLILFIFIGFLSSSAQSVDRDQLVATLEPEIHKAMLEGQIPSMTIALVVGDEIIWEEGYGYANRWARTRAVPSTVYLIGSTFKAMSSVALLQQMEQGKFQLDDPVHQYLSDFRIQNEDANTPVTFRQMFTHTSGMPVDFGPFPVWGDTVPPPLDEYLETSLRVTQPPMTSVVYSNMAYSLIGYLVEKFSGQAYKSYIQEKIWNALDMTDTAFAPTPKMEERLAIPYALDSEGQVVPTVRLKASVWPAGIVYGTVGDQARWLIANLNGGQFNGEQVLRAETLNQMHTRQFDQFKGPVSNLWGSEEAGYGLTWWTDTRPSGRYFAHSGSVPGYTAFLQGNLDHRVGIALLTNGHRSHPHLVKLAEKALALLIKAQETTQD